MTKKRTLVAVIAGAGLFATACDNSKLTAVNDNPNSPVDAPSTTLFTSAARNGVGRWEDGVGGTRYAFLAQHLAEVQYPDADDYIRLKASSTSGLFNSSYSVELEDLQIVRGRGLAANDPGLWGPATVLQSWEFGVLTDVFGDIPYSQAFKADSGVLTPAYDTQQSIYADLFTRLSAASTALGTASNSLGSADPIYAGSPSKWQKFANSLRARHALRLINVDPTTANTQLTAALSNPAALILTNDDNAKMVWPGDGIYDNPWATNFKGRDDHRISTRLLTYMRMWNDPRTPIYAMPAAKDTIELTDTTAGVITAKTLNYCVNASDCYVGLGNGLTQAKASSLVPYTSRPGAIFYPGATAYGTFGGGGGSFPSYLMTAAEVAFIRAEAAERNIGGLTAAQAKAFYNAGITLSMEMWKVPAADIAAYLATPGVAYDTAGTTVSRQKQIAIQKWLALYIDPIQAWSGFRRTCQPAILKPGPNAVESAIPRRLYYSTTERAVNGANLDAAIARQGTDNFRTRIYWDKSPTAAPTYETGCGVR